MLECWVYRNGSYFYKDGTDQKIKSDHHPSSDRPAEFHVRDGLYDRHGRGTSLLQYFHAVSRPFRSFNPACHRPGFFHFAGPETQGRWGQGLISDYTNRALTPLWGPKF